MKINPFLRMIAAALLVLIVTASTIPLSVAAELSGDSGEDDGIMLLANPTTVEINFEHSGYSWTNQLKLKYPCDDDTPGYDLSTSGYGYENVNAGHDRNVIYYGSTRKLETEVYCVEPGAHLNDGDSISVGTTYAKAWKGYSGAQKNAVNLTLYYGRPGNHNNLSGSNNAQWIATQLIIWEFVTGTRSPTAPYNDCDNGTTSGSGYSGAPKTIYNAFFGKDGDHNTDVLKVYNEILAAMRNHSKLPSFMASTTTSASTQELTMSSSGYTYTFTDSNNVLANFDFTSDNSNVKCSVSGNKLTVTSSVPLTSEATITATQKISGAGLAANLTVAGTAGYQNVVWGADLPTANKAYLKVTAKGGSGKISLSKTNSAKEAVAGVEYTLYGWAKANSGYTTKYAASVQTTDTSGNIAVGKFPTLSWTDKNDGKFVVVETSVSGAKGVKKDGNAAAINLQNGTITYYANADVTVSADGAVIKSGAKAVKTVSMSKDSAGAYVVSLSFSDSPWTTKLTLYKTCFQTGEDLKNAEFTLYRWDGSKYVELEKLSAGKDAAGRACYSSSLLTYVQKSAGKYRIIETKAPDGVLYDASKPWTQDVVWTEADQTFIYPVTNVIPEGSLTIRKTDADTGEAMANVSFTVTAAEDIKSAWGTTLIAKGTKVGTVTTNTKGAATLASTAAQRIYPGKYTIAEQFTSAAKGYWLAAPVDAVIPFGNGVDNTETTVTVDVKDNPMKPSMAVAKLASKTTGATLEQKSGRYQGKKKSAIYDAYERVTFTLTVTNTGDRDLYNLQLDDDTSDFAPYIHNNSFAYDVKKGSKLTTNKGNTVTVTSISKKGNTYSIGFDKLNVGDSFNVTASCILFSNDGDHNDLDNIVHLTSQYDASDDGTDGNDLTDTPDTIKDGDNHSWDDDAINLRAHGSILLQKKGTNGSSLAGVTFALLDANGKEISTKTTDKNGSVKWDNLPLSSYSIIETETISGMSLLAAPIEVELPVIKTEAEVKAAGLSTDGILCTDATFYFFDQTLTIKNSPTLHIPHTGGTEIGAWRMGAVGLLAMLAGELILLRRSTRE